MQLGIFSLVFASLSAPFALASPTPEGAVILGNLTVATELRVLPPNLRVCFFLHLSLFSLAL